MTVSSLDRRARTRRAQAVTAWWSLALAGSVSVLSACDDDGARPAHDASVDPVEHDASTPDEDASVPPEDAGMDAEVPDPPDAGADSGADQDGSTPDAGPAGAPPLRTRVDLPDRELAEQALRVLGSPLVGGQESCSSCHSLGRSTLSRWRLLTDDVTERCLADTSLPNAQSIDEMLACLAYWEKAFTPGALGVYAAAAHLPWFEYAFEHRSDAGSEWRNAHDRFVAQAGMPRAGTRLTQAQFDLVAEWFARGTPNLVDIVPPDGGQVCTANISPQLLTHIDQMATAGWRAKNRENGLLMYGCPAGKSGLDCLADLPRARDTTEGATWDRAGSTLRVLFDNSRAGSQFWTRSSADGRYLASGGAAPGQDENSGSFLGAKIVDLARGVYIPLDGLYDPGFFPDDQGFVMQAGQGALVCDQSVLASNPAEIRGTEPQCGYFSVDKVGIYEQVGRAVGGGDYWAAAGQFNSDDGSFVGQDPEAPFGEDSTLTLTPMINEGNRFRDGPSATLATPDQGDPVISASGTLLITRVKGEEVEDEFGVFTAKQSGYAIQRIQTTRSGDTLSATLEPMARVCVNGGKPMLSFDERFMVVHQYVSPESAADLGFSDANDPAFRNYVESGTSNLVLIDLKTGDRRRITDMKPGQKALFPHFRSDGWIYFIVRYEGHELLMASDAALVWEAAAGQ